MQAIQISNLSFCYPGQPQNCLSGINLQVQKGERFGLFGPNGAGKTTLLSLVIGILQSSEGAVKIFGQALSSDKNIKSQLGFVPQDFAFYPELSPVENLHFFGAWSGLNRQEITNRTDELLTVLGLNDVRNKLVKTFSGGMKRRVNLAIGVIHKPQILFLDEPTVGVDVQTRHSIINYLKELNAAGATLVYTSHHLQEAEDLCNRIALIDEGKIVAHDDLKKILAHHQQENLEDLFLKLTGKAYRD